MTFLVLKLEFIIFIVFSNLKVGVSHEKLKIREHFTAHINIIFEIF